MINLSLLCLGASSENFEPSLDRFEILLDNKRKSYYPGQLLSGNVVIVTKRDILLRAIRLRVCGETKVLFTETHGNSDENGHPTIYKASEIYVKEEKTLWGDYFEGTEETELEEFPTGSYSYPFQFQLPKNSVASLERDLGHVKYYLKLIMDNGPWKFDDYTVVPITVLPVFDLKLIPETANPVESFVSKEFLFSEGVMEVTAQVPKLGYIPDEVIPVSAHIYNSSEHRIVGVDMKLVQTTTFTGYCGETVTVRSDSAVVAETDRDFAADLKKHTNWVITETLAVPQTLPSFYYSPYIHLTYKLHLRIVPSGMTAAIELELPIMIGTLPVLPFFHAVMPSAPPEWATDDLLEQQFQEQLGLIENNRPTGGKLNERLICLGLI